MANITIENTQVYLSQKQYFEKIIAQISKDLNSDEFDEAIEGVSFENPDQLLFILKQYLIHLESTSAESFFQSMYRIDIPDADFKAQIIESGVDFETLAELVVKRELLKILLREKYS